MEIQPLCHSLGDGQMTEMIYFDLAGARYFGNGLSVIGTTQSHFHKFSHGRLSEHNWPLMTEKP